MILIGSAIIFALFKTISNIRRKQPEMNRDGEYDLAAVFLIVCVFVSILCRV